MKPYKLFWSHIESYEECPQKFLWSRGYGTIDLGSGPGRAKPVPPEDKTSEHHSLMGTVIAASIERLYNDELWRDPATLNATMTQIVDREFQFQLRKSFLKYADEGKDPKWDESPTPDMMRETCLKGVLDFIGTMKKNKLLGPYAKAEVNLTGYLSENVIIAGRPDLIVRRDDVGVAIYDGKNSQNPGKYTNPDQLKWYALCFFKEYNVVPSKLGFIYFRYPPGNPPKDYKGDQESWTGVVDVPFTKDDLKLLAHRATQTYEAIVKESFDPSPSPKACRFCAYKNVCDAYLNRTPMRTHKPKSDGEEIIAKSDGIVEFGIGDKA